MGRVPRVFDDATRAFKMTTKVCNCLWSISYKNFNHEISEIVDVFDFRHPIVNQCV